MHISQLRHLLPSLLLCLGCAPGQPGLDDGGGSTTSPGESGSEDTGGSDDTTTGETEDTGEPAVCGNGIVEPGEICDDGNDDDDICDQACQPIPCAIEWSVHDPMFVADRLSTWAPVVLDGDELVVAHQILPNEFFDTRVARFSTADGAPLGSFEGSLWTQEDFPQELVLLPDGDLLLGSTVYFGSRQLDIQRLGPDGSLRWLTVLPEHVYTAGMQLGPDGLLKVVATSELSPNGAQPALVTLDPEDGSELGSRLLGPGDSLDYARALVTDAQGHAYVAWKSDALDVSVVSAIDDSDALMWETNIDRPGYIEGFDAGPDGTLFALISDWSDSRAWVVALDPASGDELWSVSDVELGIAGSFPTMYMIAASSAGVRVVGSLSYSFENEWYTDASVVGIALDGTPLCHTTITSLTPESQPPLLSLRLTEVIAADEHSFYAVGPSYVDMVNTLEAELLRARFY